MNISTEKSLLIHCVGRRVELIEWFVAAAKKRNINLYVDDIDKNAPAYSVGEKYNGQKITHELTLVDSNLLSLSENKSETIKLISNYDIIWKTLDKYLFYEYFRNIINVPPTLIIKNRYGSASMGLEKIRQPFLDGQEWNIQLYFDFISGKIVSVFMQEKILMRAGETERGRSAWNEELWKQCVKLERHGFYGPVDIDAIIAEKEYIIDINPRFGGGYQMAHHCGVNFVELILNNIEGIENHYQKPFYVIGKIFAKYDRMMEICL